MAAAFVICVLMFVPTLIFATDHVPVLIWQSNGDKVLPSASAGDHLSVKQFEEFVTQKVNSNGTIIVFMQDSLSLEDFTLYGNAYGRKSSKSAFTNLQKILQSYPSTLLPSVESPSNGVHTLAKDGRKIVSKTSDADLSDADSADVIVFDLLGTGAALDRQQALNKNDQIIGRVMKKAKDLFPSFLAVYTAKTSSWIRSSDDGERMGQLSRHLLAAEPLASDAGNYSGVFKSFGNCFLMYAKNLTFKVTTQLSTENKEFFTNTSSVPLEELDIDPSSSCAGNNSAVIIFKYKNVVSSDWLQTLQFTFNFTLVRTGEWYLTMIDLVYHTTDSKGAVGADLRTSDAWAPLRFSWNCGTARFADVNRTYPRVELEFNKLQMQAFDVSESFGDAYDCIGFFTVGIWMSIFSSIILIAILCCGISMVMSIQSMDRFDDPKGKTITVSAID